MIKKFLSVLALTAMLGASTADAQNNVLTGAGATFPTPLYQQWAQQVRANLGFQVNYQSLGSGAGINQITNRTVHFGATDSPLSVERQQAINVIQIPTVLGSLVLGYNLPGVPDGALRLTPEVLVRIYQGQITQWRDPQILAINPGVPIPRLPISVLHRADGSGTTWIFTQYLMAISDSWRTGPGSGTSISWPAGIGARGNEGVSSQVRRQPGAIGYMESSFAVINRIPMAQLQNAAGNFVRPSTDNIQASAAQARFLASEGFVPQLINQPGAHSWPIVGATYLLIPTNQTDAGLNRMMFEFVRYAFEQGDASAARLHYVPLPAPVKQQLLQTLRQVLNMQ